MLYRQAPPHVQLPSKTVVDSSRDQLGECDREHTTRECVHLNAFKSCSAFMTAHGRRALPLGWPAAVQHSTSEGMVPCFYLSGS